MSSTWTASICKSRASICLNMSCAQVFQCVLAYSDWEACAYYCDAKPVDCGCYGCPQPCTCQPAGFGTKVAQTVNALGKKLLQKKRKLTVALGVLKKDLNGQLVPPPYVCTLAGPPACTEAMSD